MSKHKDILIVDDSLTIRAALDQFIGSLRDFNAPVLASDGKEALALVQEHFFDAILLDLTLPDIDGLEILDQMLERSGQRVMILSSRVADGEKERDKAMAQGACACFDKSQFMKRSDEFAELLRGVADRRVCAVKQVEDIDEMVTDI